VTPRQQLIAAVTAVICIPLAFALVGGGQGTGLIIGVVLVVGGLSLGLLGR
jgi:hypothetical protein